eukprot:1287467-Rhodomonas_salina.1
MPCQGEMVLPSSSKNMRYSSEGNEPSSLVEYAMRGAIIERRAASAGRGAEMAEAERRRSEAGAIKPAEEEEEEESDGDKKEGRRARSKAFRWKTPQVHAKTALGSALSSLAARRVCVRGRIPRAPGPAEHGSAQAKSAGARRRGGEHNVLPEGAKA